MSLDFARARRNPFFSLLALDKVEDSFLSLRQHTLRIAYDTGNASSNEQDPFSGAGRGADRGAVTIAPVFGATSTKEPNEGTGTSAVVVPRATRAPTATPMPTPYGSRANT